MCLAMLCSLLSACGISSTPSDPLADGALPEAFPTTWQLSEVAPHAIHDFTFASSNTSIGYACAAPEGELAVFVTHDAGESWSAASPLPMPDATYCQLVVDDDDAANLILGLGTDVPQASIQSAAPRLLYHSRDGGATWSSLPALPPIAGINARNTIDGVAVSGERILASVRIETSPSPYAIGVPIYALYAVRSDGRGWTRIDQAFTARGLGAGGLLSAGAAELVSAYPGTYPDASPSVPQGNVVPGADRAATSNQGTADAASPTQPFGHPFSGPVPGAQIYRSTDGGVTWAHVSLPATHPSLCGFVRARDGSTYYGAGTDDGQGGLLYSTDGGTTWAALPLGTGLRSRAGRVLSMGGSNKMIAAAPDGSVFAPLQVAASAQPEYESQPAQFGILRLQPGTPDAQWEPLAAGPWVGAWRATPLPTGIRLWGLRTNTPQSGGELVYIDVPGSGT
jgi:photosystem II stability/assembly factor-like uncharacterized protein